MSALFRRVRPSACFAKTEPKAWEVIIQIEAKLNGEERPRAT